ncbi:glycoside/pentoside/hexuronide:cation symporter, GPH family/glucuronide carrier protein [Anaerovirgula multivorans]|uniref:Glycoside/pentoside/hexuronide:cation symporter, GPH family/glucuronide carrier protein n=1 Tax=Anaerovirgula multivorans TaxID=312168 RepID=A0A239IX38_9FIRM|nr:glycoside-pentoside-hexuronide (GPH):cation symporter [Anaerovirgula multivorans]SNS97788.1 glycoside/pentoside/hexuronide:cation symporter, GPH family/glucuronide carrier protein [Anaerovirgula multivorans]
MENISKSSSKSLRKSIINLYGLPSFGFQLFVNMEVFYFAAFLTDFAMIPVALAGTILMVTSIFDIIWVPTAGVILEKSNLKFGGKYRSWLLVGPPFAVLFFIFQFIKIGPENVNAIIIMVGFIVSHLIWNIYYAAHIAMNNSMTTIREERISMASNRGMFNALGAIGFSLIGFKMATIIGARLGNQAIGFTLTVVFTGIIMILCNLSLFAITKDYAHHGETKKSVKEEEKMSIGEMLKQIVVNPPLIGLMLAELGRYLGRFVIFGLAFYYFKYVVENIAMITIFMTGLNVVCFFGAMLTAPLAKKFGERNTYILSLALFIIGLIAVWVLPMNYLSFMIIMFVAYLGYGMPDALGVAMYSATVDYGEWKTGKNARGFIMSLISFPIKTAIFVRSIVITAVLTSAGYVADMTATPELIQGIKNGIALVPAIFIGVGLVIIVMLYKITPESLKKMQEEIAARK